MTGEVSDDIWKRSDLVLGDVLGQGTKTGSVHEGWWRIEDMKSHMVILRMVGEGDKAGDSTIQVSRSELLTSWSKRYIEEEVAYTTDDYKNPLSTAGWQGELWKGVIRGALDYLYAASSEQDVQQCKKPRICVRAMKDFGVGKMTLVPLSPGVLALTLPTLNSALPLGKLATGGDEEDSHTPLYGYIKSCTMWPRPGCPETFLVAFWQVRETFAVGEANAELWEKRVTSTFACGKNHVRSVNIPVIVNMKPIKRGEEILIPVNAKKRGLAFPPEPLAPAPKAPRGGKGKGRGKGKK